MNFHIVVDDGHFRCLRGADCGQAGIGVPKQTFWSKLPLCLSHRRAKFGTKEPLKNLLAADKSLSAQEPKVCIQYVVERPSIPVSK
jgi:hypothetical protein